MAAGRKPTPLELPTVSSSFEGVTEFAEGACKAGRWSVNANRGENGVSLFFAYDGKPVKISFWSILFGSFDFNEWKGEGTYSCKLSSTAILISALTPKAKERVIQSFAKLKADQAVFKDVALKFIRANGNVVPCRVDYETGKPEEPRVFTIARMKAPKPDPSKPSKDMTPFYQVSATLQIDRSEKDVRRQAVLTPIIINGRPVSPVTRGDLYELIKGKRFLKFTEGEFSAFFSNENTLYLQVRASIERMQALQSAGEISSDEMKKIVADTTSMFADLGIQVGEPESLPSAQEAESGPLPTPDPTVDALGQGFTELEQV